MIVDETTRHRFSIEQDGATAELRYRLDGDHLVLEHTLVPRALGGRGIGARLVEAALRRAREESLVVVAECPFANAWLRRHPRLADGLRVEYP